MAIDAYTQYIIWAYAGISAQTAVSCVKQYLTAVRAIDQQPTVIQSDRGSETVLMAAAHWKLRNRTSNVPLSDCYYYGTSVANQHIEA